MNIQDILYFIEHNPKLIQKKQISDDLYLLKYSRKVFYDSLWTPELEYCRGMILDSNNQIVQLPFTKIYNYQENNTVIDPDHNVLYVDKINGFMAAVTYHNDDILVSTTGSTDSEFVTMAKEKLPLDMMRDHLKANPTLSFCFEIVHENDPHIIPERPGVYLIGGRKKEIGSKQIPQYNLDHIAKYWNVLRPTYGFKPFSQVLEQSKTYTREGFVVYDTISETVLKLKTPYYLINKFLARTKKFDLIFGTNHKTRYDEEFYPLLEYLNNTYTKESFEQLSEQERLTVFREFFDNDICYQ